MSKSSISIIGLGWLGLPLYNQLSQLSFPCIGSTTSIEKKDVLQKQGVSVAHIELKETEIKGDINAFFQNAEILILNTPPGLRRNPDSNYVAKIERLLPYIEKSTIKKVLYISSTSVFEDEISFPRITNETQPNANSNVGIQIRNVEKLLFQNRSFQTTILRFSGLVDERRHPATMMSRRASVNNPEAPVNLIHRDDCIGVIWAIIGKNKWGMIFNASFPMQMSKREYYTSICESRGLSIPNFNNSIPSKGKLIEGNHTASVLNYKYKYVV